jgi:streptomycin 6-kinase
MTAVPERFARITADLYGPAGGAWLDRLPDLVAECARRWSLTVLPPFADLSYNYVAPAVRADGADVVLKLGFPDPELNSQLGTEIAALWWSYEDHGGGCEETIACAELLAALEV